MKAILFVVMGLGLAVVGCGNNACEDAADKFDECGIPKGADYDEAEVEECNEQSECVAKCLNDASCDDIKAALGITTPAVNDVSKCVLACQ